MPRGYLDPTSLASPSLDPDTRDQYQVLGVASVPVRGVRASQAQSWRWNDPEALAYDLYMARNKRAAAGKLAVLAKASGLIGDTIESIAAATLGAQARSTYRKLKATGGSYPSNGPVGKAVRVAGRMASAGAPAGVASALAGISELNAYDEKMWDKRARQTAEQLRRVQATKREAVGR